MENIKKLIQQNFTEAENVLAQFSTPENFEKIAQAAQLMVNSIKNNGKIISCGNGGSMCDAMHFAEEITGRFRLNRKALPAVAISDPAHITCVANDYGYEYIFQKFVEGVGLPQDVLLAISTSGNSQNVLLAAQTALEKGMKVVALTGKGGGKLADLATIEIRAPHSDFADRPQEIHIKIIHSLIHSIEQIMGV
jgi:D-sedoheptulose 7-phosphate isomerase